jgi:hypothetical protein
MSHPFHIADFLESPGEERKNAKPSLYAYVKVHQFSAVLPGEHIAYLGNWIYVYPSATNAVVAAEIFAEEILASGGESLGAYTSGIRNVTGQVYSAKGDEQSTVYWFIGTVDDRLFLVLADSLQQETAKDVLKGVLKLSPL